MRCIPSRGRCYLLLRVVGLSLLILIAGCSKPKREADCGFVQNVYGERVSWKQNSPVLMTLHTSVPPQFEDSIRGAAETWNRSIGKTMIVIAPHRIGGTVPGRDKQNIIYYMNTWETDKASEQGRTSLYWVGDQIQEADIRINGQNYAFFGSTVVGGAVSMESLALHELGHVLGLKHNDSSPSVMATYLRLNQDRTQLQGSDQESLNCEY